MKLAFLLLCAAPLPALAGTIQGTVVNTSSGSPVPCQVAIILQARVKGQLVPLRDTISDPQGHYCFKGLPVDDGVVYQPGATRGGVFYPGPWILLTRSEPVVTAALAVCDAAASPSPLVLKKMDVTIRPETGLLKVTEALLIDNPSHTCYVGLATRPGASPVTLELSIPPEFERTTFEREFFGRRFIMLNGKLVTGIPWPPGEREVRYTYVLRNTQAVLRWKRPLDLPCSNVTVRVEGKSPSEVHCGMLRQASADAKAVVFDTAGRELAAGEALQVELGRLPLPWMVYGKWAALGILAGLIAAASWLGFRHRRPAGKETAETPKSQITKKKAA